MQIPVCFRKKSVHLNQPEQITVFDFSESLLHPEYSAQRRNFSILALMLALKKRSIKYSMLTRCFHLRNIPEYLQEWT